MLTHSFRGFRPRLAGTEAEAPRRTWWRTAALLVVGAGTRPSLQGTPRDPPLSDGSHLLHFLPSPRALQTRTPPKGRPTEEVRALVVPPRPDNPPLSTGDTGGHSSSKPEEQVTTAIKAHGAHSPWWQLQNGGRDGPREGPWEALHSLVGSWPSLEPLSLHCRPWGGGQARA